MLKAFLNTKFHLHFTFNPIIRYLAANMEGLGVTGQFRELPVIVSLTSYEGRFSELPIALYSLLNQSFKPDRIILWLSDRYDLNSLPYEITHFVKNGLEIRFVRDIRAYTKIIYALKEFSDSIIVTADDDVYYHKNWLKKLYYSYILNPDDIHVHKACRVVVREEKIQPYEVWEKSVDEECAKYEIFPKSVGGVLYPPKSLSKEVLREDIFLKHAPYTVDVWLWIMALLNDKKARVVNKHIKMLKYVKFFQRETLSFGDNFGHRIDIQLENLMKLYGNNILKKLNQLDK